MPASASICIHSSWSCVGSIAYVRMTLVRRDTRYGMSLRQLSAFERGSMYCWVVSSPMVPLELIPSVAMSVMSATKCATLAHTLVSYATDEELRAIAAVEEMLALDLEIRYGLPRGLLSNDGGSAEGSNSATEDTRSTHDATRALCAWNVSPGTNAKGLEKYERVKEIGCCGVKTRKSSRMLRTQERGCRASASTFPKNQQLYLMKVRRASWWNKI